MASPSSVIPTAAIALLVSSLLGTTPAGVQIPPQPRTPERDARPAERRGTGVIRGTVLAADTGRPLRRARVTIVSSELGSDSRRSTSTGIDGRYEFKEVPAARFRVSVTRGGYLPLDYGQRRPGEIGRPVQIADGQVLEKIDIVLPRMGAISGRITDETGDPIEGITVIATRLLFFEGHRRLVPISSVFTDDAGEYRIQKLPPGMYYLRATTQETWTVVENGKESVLGYMPTYYPGVPNSTDATRVTLTLGQTMGAMDFALVPGRAARVSGRAVDSQGRPFARVSLQEEIRGLTFGSFRAGPGAPVAGDGSFTISSVPPSEYTLTATRTATDHEPPEVALMRLFVEGVDLENIVLTGSSGGTVSGRIIVEGSTPPKMSAVRVTVTEPLRNQPSPALLGAFRTQGRATGTKEDGTFVAEHVFGRTRFQVTLPEGWMLKAVVHAGRDITDEVVELKSGEELRGLEVVITDRVTSVSGQLIDDKQKPIRDATVLVFPSDAEKWYESSRRIRAARPDQQGHWQFKGLAAGEYLVAALDYVEDGAWHDPEYLESLRRMAQTITISEGGAETMRLNVVGPSREPSR